MAYTALYRKFRPGDFDNVKGQEHIVTTLKNQIKNERTSHAYLFCGTRGTGKTTIAKIFAKAVNCENPQDGSPCGECAMCKSIAEGSSMNVIEMDAASNNSVDNIRQIVEEVTYRPPTGKFRVYIIDEVHMLSTGAFNALLKTLEEPPEYVIFILATTEAHKLPITILSRCQRYDFRRISLETISDRLKELMEKENVSIEEKAVRYIARMGDGSMRDALSLLDQCIAFNFGEVLTYDKVLNVLGAVDTEVFSRLLRAIIDGQVTEALKILEEVIIQGRELTQFVTDMTWYLRNLLLLKTADTNEEIIDLSSDNMARLKEEATMISDEIIMRYIRVLSELSGQLKYASQKRILTEVALIKLMRPQMEENIESLNDRVRIIENKLESGDFVVASNSAPVKQAAPSANKPAENIVLEKALPEDIQEAVRKWNMIVADSDRVFAQYLSESYPSVEGEDTLAIVFRQEFSYMRFKEPQRLAELANCISNIVGKEIKVSVRLDGSDGTDPNTFPDIRTMVEEKIDFEIDEISEDDDEDDDEEEFFDDIEE